MSRHKVSVESYRLMLITTLPFQQHLVCPLLWIFATVKLCILLLAPVPSRKHLPPPPSSRRPSAISLPLSFVSSRSSYSTSSSTVHDENEDNNVDPENPRHRVQDALALQKEEIRWGWRSFVALISLCALCAIVAGVVLSWHIMKTWQH